MPYADPDKKREWDRVHRPEHGESFRYASQRKKDLEVLFKRKLTWKEFRLYDTGEAIAPDHSVERDAENRGIDFSEPTDRI